MGVLKDAFYLEAWRHLLRCPRAGVHLSTITNTTAIGGGCAKSWAALQAGGKAEGLKKGSKLKDILSERSDIFHFAVLDNGHPMLSLQEGARTLKPDDGLPAQGTVPTVEPPAALENGDSPADEALKELGASKRKRPPSAPSEQGAKKPAAKKAKTSTKSGTYVRKVDAASPWTPIRGRDGYRDIVWTPALQAQFDKEVSSETHMIWALYEAVNANGSSDVPVSQLGSDHKVSQLKKDPQFKNVKLLDLLKAYDKVFIVQGDDVISTVSMQLDGEASLPEPDEALAQEINRTAQLDLMLPPRIQNPAGAAEKMQALRIEIMHLLTRREEGKAPVQELGQDPRITKSREGITQGKSLQGFIKIFPGNFTLINEDGIMQVVLVDYGVEDTSMIGSSIRQNQAVWDANQARGGWGHSSPAKQWSPAPNHQPSVVPARFPGGVPVVEGLGTLL